MSVSAKMFKSKFNIARDKEEEATLEEQHETVAAELEPEEIPEPIQVKTLSRYMVSSRFSLLGKTADGDGYTYLKATCTEMGLTDIKALTYFKHLQFVDVSNNNLTSNDIQVLADLPYLLVIHADNNQLNTAFLKKMKYLQVIIMNENQINSVSNIFQPELSTLEIAKNKIEAIDFNYPMPNMRVIDFRYNFIKEIPEMNFPNLDSLYLAGNKIKSLVGIEVLENLRVLHVRNNPLRLLNGFSDSNKKLQYLNLRNCKVATLIQIKKLRILPALETLIIKGTPFLGGSGMEPQVQEEEDDPEARTEVIASLLRLKRLNKITISPEERHEAQELRNQWLEEGENDEEEAMLEEHMEEEQIKED